MTSLTQATLERLRATGLECFLGVGTDLPDDFSFEPPCSIKWMHAHFKLRIGAFSYAVSGFYFNVGIGRYTSIGETVQVGRGDHPTSWVTTSPAFYVSPLFQIGREFDSSDLYDNYKPNLPDGKSAGTLKFTNIGNDVYIGHGAFIRPGLTIGDGSIIAANSVVVKDVPPYAVVAGNPATVKKMRIPERLIEPLLAVEWWRFAPWQLQTVDMTDPEIALPYLQDLCSRLEPYVPGFKLIQEFIDPKL